MPNVLTKPRPKNRASRKVEDGVSIFFEFMREFALWSKIVRGRFSRAYIKAGIDDTIELYLIRNTDGYDIELQSLFSFFKQSEFDSGRHIRGMILPESQDVELEAFFSPAVSILIPMV